MVISKDELPECFALPLRILYLFTAVPAVDLIEDFENHCTVIELTVSILKNASSLRGGYNFSFWDSLIIASALSAGASILYSEDMQDGLVVVNKLEIVNPFK